MVCGFCDVELVVCCRIVRVVYCCVLMCELMDMIAVSCDFISKFWYGVVWSYVMWCGNVMPRVLCGHS